MSVLVSTGEAPVIVPRPDMGGKLALHAAGRQYPLTKCGLMDVLEHPNQERYPGQMIYVVEIESYVYLVPFVTAADGSRVLKTIIPSRKPHASI